MKNNIMTVYGHGTQLGGIDFEAIMSTVEQGVAAVTKVVSAGKTLLTPTQKARTSAITGSTSGISTAPYGVPQKSFPIVPVAIGGGVLLLAAFFLLKR